MVNNSVCKAGVHAGSFTVSLSLSLAVSVAARQ